MAKQLANYLNIQDNETLLDYGCARGFLVRALRHHGVKAYGYDISEWAITNCDPNIKDYVGLNLNPKAKYDHIVSLNVLEHIPNDELNGVLSSIFKMAKKTTTIVVPLTSTPNGQYVYSDDEKDSTHVQRKTFGGWITLLRKHADDKFLVTGGFDLDLLKLSVKNYPNSTGLFHIRRIR